MMLDMSTSPEEVASATREVFARHPDVRTAFLFGSVARRTARSDSDVDIAVTGARVDLAGLASELSLVVGCEVDLVSLDSDPPIALLRELIRDGICLHESERGAATAVRTRALWAIETDGPIIDALAKRYVDRLAARAHS
jgi:predicted nucleotidyltransferase